MDSAPLMTSFHSVSPLAELQEGFFDHFPFGKGKIVARIKGSRMVLLLHVSVLHSHCLTESSVPLAGCKRVDVSGADCGS